MAVTDSQLWEAACMTSLAAQGRKCPDFDNVLSYLPGAFKDAKAARNRWEKLMRDIKNKDLSDVSTTSTPVKNKKSASIRKTPLKNSAKVSKVRKCSEDETSDFSMTSTISHTEYMEPDSTSRTTEAVSPLDLFMDEKSPFKGSGPSQETPTRASGRKRKREAPKYSDALTLSEEEQEYL